MKKQINHFIVGLLILSLTSYSLKAADTNSITITKQQAPAQQVQPANLIAYCAIAAAAAYVVYSIYKCVQAAGMSNAPAPPSNGGTNSSSIVFLPADGPTLPIGNTNINIISTTNSAAPAPTVIFPNVFLATNNDANVETKWDISTNGWTDWQGNPYTWLVITHTDLTGPHVQTSTNLTTWTDSYQSIYTWFSSTVSPDPDMNYLTNMATVIYDGDGTPTLTNFAALNPSALANFGVSITTPQMFFRGVTP